MRRKRSSAEASPAGQGQGDQQQQGEQQAAAVAPQIGEQATQATGVTDPGLSLNVTGGGSTAVKLFLLITVLSFATTVLFAVTSFSRIVIVLGFLRQALGTPQVPPNQVMIALALALATSTGVGVVAPVTGASAALAPPAVDGRAVATGRGTGLGAYFWPSAVNSEKTRRQRASASVVRRSMFSQGTGSRPAVPSGWQRPIRRRVNQPPCSTP